MDDIIARLETATEGSRELDADIHAAIYSDGERLRKFYARRPKYIPHYTTSLDAALTLVPEGFDEEIKRARHRRGWRAGLWGVSGVGQTADAPTPALALCIAALKARA